MLKIKFTDLYKLVPQKKKIFSKINQLIRNSRFVGGEEVKKFEKKFSKFVKAKYFISVANGTDALEIAIKSLNLKKGSEIIIPVNTWISTAEAIITNGHKVVFCDVNLKDYSICFEDLNKKINSKTRAIIAVHLYGNPTDITKIKKIIRNRNIKIVEDCAQAHGTRIRRKHVGTFGDVGTFSFFPGKNLGAFGDAGGIVTNSKKIFEFCKRYKSHGALNKYDHKFSGRNSRLDTINAAILNIKLNNYNIALKKRNSLAKIYFKNFEKNNDVQTYKLDKKNISSFHQFVIRTKLRDKLQKFLAKNNIKTMIHYPYMLNELKFFKYKKKLKKSYKLGKHILSLPISEEHSKKEIKFVSQKVNDFFNLKLR